MRCPSATPAGNRTLSVRVLVTPPVPRHSGHFSSTTVPTPWHSRHGSEKLNEPWLRVTSPEPWHCGQVRGWVPGLAPLPWQVSQTPGARSVSGSVTPATASPKSSATSASTSRPRAGPRGCAGAPPAAREDRAEQVGEAGAAEPAVAPVPAVPPPPPKPPNRSERSNGRSRPAGPPPAGRCAGTRPQPKSERISSYSLRRPASESTSYASETALNRSSASLLPGLWSGCRLPGQLAVRLLDLVGGGGLRPRRARRRSPSPASPWNSLSTSCLWPGRSAHRARRVVGPSLRGRRPRPAPAAAAARRAGSRGASRRCRSAR